MYFHLAFLADMYNLVVVYVVVKKCMSYLTLGWGCVGRILAVVMKDLLAGKLVFVLLDEYCCTLYILMVYANHLYFNDLRFVVGNLALLVSVVLVC